MITALVQSAFQTGHLSVESEALIRQVLPLNSCQPADLEALARLYEALRTGRIQREAHQSIQFPALEQCLKKF
ncbi:hypothetical protein [Leptodesmis sp.]|uniref:hypothetical protein n=1 Tax=Leptodesmis sp. TaxID=3100501 RepID=UPI0040534E70